MSTSRKTSPHFVPFPEEEIEQSLPERFEKQVAKYPQGIAVKTQSYSLTYEILNKSANRLARVLRQRRDGNEPVAILIEHDAPAIIAIWGVLKAGRMFFLIDPAAPDARIGHIVKHARAGLLVSNDRSLDASYGLVKTYGHTLNIDHLDPHVADDNLNLRISPDQVSSILYTSGSTGAPKGVLQTHRNELFNIRHHTNSLSISCEDHLTLLGSYSTGQGMQDIYCSLLNGATVYPWNLKAHGLTGLADWLMTESITIYHSAASVFRHFVRNLRAKEKLTGLRIVRVGSESVFWKDFELYQKHFSDECLFVNALSSSEARTFCQIVLDKRSSVAGVVPVGYPVPGKAVLVVDEDGNKAPPDVAGEIVISSRYIAPGYWEDPDLSTKAFLPDPDDPRCRTYRTGDLGCLSTDGCLSHLGRKDAQVKIRGFRVEILEVELALLSHSSVDQACVVSLDNVSGEKCLTAYIVAVAGVTPPSTSELRSFVGKQLPEYMVPSSFVFMKELPLTPTGKIQRRDLPKPRSERPTLDVPFTAPSSATEKAVAAIWTELLGVNEVGTHDHLFDLGGNSLLAMQIVSRVEKLFHVGISLKRFFESPTIETLCACLSGDSRLQDVRTFQAIEVAALDDRIPLSFSQERIWFLDRWNPGQPTYNICQAYRLKGSLDIDSVNESLNRLTDRHAILRTTFPVVDDRPWQNIAPTLTLSAEVIDLQGLLQNEREKQCPRLIRTQAQKPFNIVEGPLLRVNVLILSDRAHVIIFTLHQLTCDGWSMQVFLREFWELYDSSHSGRPADILPLHFQYADFAVWQRKWVNEELLNRQLSYWQEQLQGELPILNLPTSYPRPTQQSFQGERIPFKCSNTLTDSLKEFSRNHDVTLFMTLMTGFITLLHRYADQDDLIIGFPVANRDWADTSALIGFFVNTLALRADISGNPTFTELLGRVKETCVEAYVNQDLPFETLVEHLRPERDMSRNPVFQTFFTFQSIQNLDFPVPGIQSEPIGVDSGTAKVDLTLFIIERESELSGYFEYSTDLFERSAIERMIGHLEALLQGIVGNPESPVSAMPLLTASERQQLLVGWNNTIADYPKHSVIHELFESQVERTPDTLALTYEGKHLTYRELNRRSNQLARYLMQIGLRPRSLVGICLERSLDMVVGVLGILKAGAAYVPLDPKYPKQRLKFMLEDSQASALITQESLLGVLSDTTDRDYRSRVKHPAVCLDRDWPIIQMQSFDNPSSGITSDDLAYVIYTSGSTGTPNGVCGLHKGAVNRFAWMWRTFPFQLKEICCIKTSLSFVDSVWEIFGPLLKGIPSILLPDDVVKDPRLLVMEVAKNHVSRIVLVPSLLRTLLNSFANLGAELPQLRFCSVSGEYLPTANAKQCQQHLPNCTFLNLYGSTEVSADVTCFDVSARNTKAGALIGRPIDNTSIFILDSRMQPVPIGVTGELYVGGDGLARGYLNRPELTTKKFTPNHITDDRSPRLYRTGDRGRYWPDGNIEFLGRADNQVKIRGNRIELGEIEAALIEHPSIQDCTVTVLNQEISEGGELIGYYVPRNPSEVTVSALRDYLELKLPAYMVPSLLVELEVVPLTPNGKIDRASLPTPDGQRPKLDQGFVDPRTDIEELVAQVWREVLRIDRIGIFDNFFDLGGHSLLATRIVIRLQTKLRVDVALRKLFELPTVASLARHIKGLRRSGAGTAVRPITPVPRDRPLPLTFSQRRLWFLQKVDSNLSAYNMPASFRIKGELDVNALARALNSVIARHEVFRAAIVEQNGQPYMEIVAVPALALPLIDISHLPDAEAEARRLFMNDVRQLHALSNPPLLRVEVVKLAEYDHVLTFNFHHIISDGSSMVVFYRELASFYNSAKDGTKVVLPPLPVQYVDYAAWHQEWLKSEDFDAQLAYWKQQIADLPPAPKLPTDFDRPLLPSHRGARLSRQLSDELTSALKRLCGQQSVTTFMMLFATLNILLSRITGHEDIVIGSTIAGRNHLETEGLVGFFINALPLRTDLSDDPSFTTLLQRVREVCLDAYTHQDVPFEKLVEAIKPQRQAGRNPIFDILFNVVDASERVFTLAGCEVSKFAQADPEAKFDIVLQAPEVDGKIELVAVYATDLFCKETIATWLDQFVHLLIQALSHPDEPVSRFSLIIDSSRTLLPDPVEALDPSWAGAIQDNLWQHAKNSPDALAIVEPNQTWTYSELERCANRLADSLITSGIEPGNPVAIYAERQASLIVAVFGVLKAGATFLILDPAYPTARTIEYLHIAKPTGWLQLAAESEIASELTSYLENSDLRWRMKLPRSKSELLQTLSGFSERPTEVRIGPNDPAYIAFTSGSTGEPKGVICRHGPMTHFLPWQKEVFALGENDRFAMLSGLAYSHLHRDVFTAIHLGATIYIPSAAEARSPDQLAGWLVNNQITILHLTPALGQLLLTRPESQLPAVRRIFFGGDVLTMDEVDRIRKLAPSAAIGSFYGATETQRAVGYFEIAKDAAAAHVEALKTIPLGRGIIDVQLLVLNRSQQLAGIGELGEIFVRSPHLAEGYIGDDERTRQMFVTNPFTNDPADRLYQTGEFGRYRPDGNVEWAGRNDRRVNIRGFRVELEEIETALKRHPAVKDAAVVLQNYKIPNPENSKPETRDPELPWRLVAYVAADEEPQSLADLLHGYLSTQLPHYMVPAHFVILISLPLNPNGKVDYRALPPARTATAATSPAAPRNEIEQRLQAIFTELLGRADIGIDDNFFRLGGHSLLAARAAARIVDAFGVNLALSTFLETPTVVGLAREVASMLAAGQTSAQSDKDQREEFDI